MAMDFDDFDFAAALSMPRRTGQTLKGRRAIDKARMSEADRRKVQTTGRTEQMNLRVSPMFKLEFGQTADALGIMQTELLDRAWAHYKDTVLNAATKKGKGGN